MIVCHYFSTTCKYCHIHKKFVVQFIPLKIIEIFKVGKETHLLQVIAVQLLQRLLPCLPLTKVYFAKGIGTGYNVSIERVPYPHSLSLPTSNMTRTDEGNGRLY